MITQGSSFLVFIIEIMVVFIPSVFKSSGGEASVCFLGLVVLPSDCGLVHHPYSLAGSIHWACALPPSAVAWRGGLLCMLSSNSTVVLGDGLSHVWHAPVRDFDSVFVNNFLEGMARGEASVYKFEKFCPNVC